MKSLHATEVMRRAQRKNYSYKSWMKSNTRGPQVLQSWKGHVQWVP